MLQTNNTISYSFPDEVISSVDVLRSVMEYRISAQLFSRFIVYHQSELFTFECVSSARSLLNHTP